MIDQKYNEVFEFIKSKLVPKNEFKESQSEILVLKSVLSNSTNDLKKMKLEFEEQKLTIDIIEAEKESLEAEKRTLEVKFNEISLKLKKKTYQYDSLLMIPKTVPKVIEQVSSSTQTIKEEPKEIGIVNLPSSSASQKGVSIAKTGAKRILLARVEVPRTKAKRKKTAMPISTFRTTKKFHFSNCSEF